MIGVAELAILAALLCAIVATVVVLVLRHRRSKGVPSASDTAKVADQVVDRLAQKAATRGATSTGRPALRDRLSKARNALSGPLSTAFDRAAVPDEAWTEVTEALIRADVGLASSSEIVSAARERADMDGSGHQGAIAALKAELLERLEGYDRSLKRLDENAGPAVWLFVGVNGTGKTTTVGKLAKQQTDQGAQVVLAAGDTFRAAAGDQLAMWAERASAHFVGGAEGADPSSVVYDAVSSAAARGADLVLADTAGRFHTEQNLMAELRKVRRVADKGAGTVTETLLVLDASTGQNGLAQARQFTQAVDLTGVVLTKLDGSAKGGIVVSVQAEIKAPVKLIGVGEGIDDLMAFDAAEFVEALFD